METVRIAIDIGSSGSKIVYLGESQVEMCQMEPQVASLNPSRLNRLELSQGGPAETAYVQIGDEVWAVGTLGRVMGGNSALKKPKREHAVEKVLAALGAVWETRGLNDDFEVEIALLLPLDEYWHDMNLLVGELERAATDFSFRRHPLKVRLKTKPVVLPEGSGLYLERGLQLSRQGKSTRERAIVVLMFGHRNLSVLTFDKGNPPTEINSTSKGPGFITYLAQCAAEIPEMKADNPALFDAVLQKSGELRVQGRSEAYNLGQIQEYASKEYLRQVRDFLLTTPTFTSRWAKARQKFIEPHRNRFAIWSARSKKSAPSSCQAARHLTLLPPII